MRHASRKLLELVIAALLFAAVSLPSRGARAVVRGEAAQVTDAGVNRASPFRGSAVSLVQALGIGTFVSNAGARNPYTATMLELDPQLHFALADVKLVADMREALSFEQTKPDDPQGRRFLYTDVAATLTAPAIWKDPWLGIGVAPSLRYTVPISPESREASSFGTLGAGVGLSRAIGKFQIGYGFRFTKGLHRYNAKVVTNEEATITDEQGHAMFFCRSGETACASAGMNSNFALRNGIQVAWQASERVSLALAYTLVNDFRYGRPDDRYTPSKQTVDGERVARPGAGRSDTAFGTLRAEYKFNERLVVGFDISTAGPARTADGKALRFPFFDLVSPARDLTTLNLGVTAAL